MSPDPTLPPTIDEDARRRFEAAWRAGKPELIEPFLPPAGHSHHLATLEELVAIDMEFRWKAPDAAPPLEDYLARFPCLDRPEVVRRLLRQEMSLRRKAGQNSPIEEYRARFPRADLTGLEADDTQATHAPAEPVRPPALPGYEILCELGRGGMGVVYKARQVALNRVVALKMVLAGAHADAEELARFRREAEAVAALRHPNVVQIHEIGEQDGRPYFSLEYVEGGSLAQKLAGKPQPPDRAAGLLETLARAVHFAHQQGVIHRDLKPANVLLTADGAPKIADFGLAKRLGADAGQTGTGQIVGTPAYMAPEQASPGSAPVGTPADVYALGAILYELLTGRPPFQTKAAWDVLLQVVSAEPAPPRRSQPRTPRDLETICLKCLRKEPARRYGSAEALAEDLRRFLTGRPIQGRRVGAAERAFKWVRRNAVASGLAAVTTLAVLGGVGGWWWAARDREARQAEANRLAAERLSGAVRTADLAMGKASASADQAAAIERAADEKGREEPETPETATQALELRRQAAAAALDEAERALADVPGTEAAQSRTAERRRAAEAELARAEKVTALLGDLDRARAALAGTSGSDLDRKAGARLYAAALSAYGLDVSRPEAETAADICKTRSGVRLALILALDDWAGDVRSDNATEAERLRRIADGADDDDWRRRCRAALGNVQALQRLADEAPGLRLPAVSLIQLGRALNEGGSRSEAAALLRAARRKHPRDFWVYFDLGHCLSEGGEVNPATLDEAEGCECAAVALRPDSPAAHVELGLVLEDQGDLAGAAECYKKAVELDPKFVVPLVNLGAVLEDQGDLAGAAECYKKAVAIDPKDAHAHTDLGVVLRRQGNLAGAAECYKKAIAIDPKLVEPHFNLGIVLQDQGDLAGAAECYEKAIAIDPTFAKAHNNLGNVRRSQSDLAGAAECYKKAVAIDPKLVLAHVNLAAVLEDQGDLAGAAECYEKAINVDPKNPLFHRNLGVVLYKQRDLEGAAAHYKQAVQLDPEDALARRYLGVVLMDQGDLTGAAQSFRKAIALVPKDAAAYVDLGSVFFNQGDLAGAADEYRKAAKLDPKNSLAHYDLGNVLGGEGDLAGAADEYRKAVELDPKDAWARYNLGLALRKLGQFAEARTTFRRCLDLASPNDSLRADASDQLRRCERLLALEAKLASVFKGERQPADDGERLGLAEVCEYQRRYAAAARFSRDAFAHDARLADDLQSGDRYAAAADAARAGCGQGEDAKDLDDQARAGWRRQALEWLRADLARRVQQLDGGKPEDRKAAGETLRSWQKGAALACVRDAEALAQLPGDEQDAWRKLWGDVQALLDKADAK